MAESDKNKAMIPIDCSEVLYFQSLKEGFSATNSITIKDIDLSISDATIASLRPFTLAGEFYIDCPTVNVTYNAPAAIAGEPTKTYTLKCRLKFDNNTTNILHFIRFFLTPNVTFKNTGMGPCKFGIDIYISINNIDKRTLSLVSTTTFSPGRSFSTGTYKFIYDIKNNTIATDTYETSL